MIIDKELLKVPADIFSVADEKLVEWMAFGTVDFNFGKQRKLNAKAAAAKMLNFFFAARFLCAKLVAGKGQYREGIIAEFFLQSTQPGVLIGEASATRDVNDKTRLAGKALKVNFFALRIGHGELVKLSHSCSLI